MTVYERMKERELDRLIDDAKHHPIESRCCRGCDKSWCDGVRPSNEERDLLQTLAGIVEGQREEIRRLREAAAS